MWSWIESKLLFQSVHSVATTSLDACVLSIRMMVQAPGGSADASNSSSKLFNYRKKEILCMNSQELVFTLWDVGHGISIWIRTPSGQHHWIDLGKTPEFSPSRHVRQFCGVSYIDYLIISHPDRDHLEDLPNFKWAFGYPRVLYRNTSLPATDMFGTQSSQYQRDYFDFHGRFNYPLPLYADPTNPQVNGGVNYALNCLEHGTTTDWGTDIQGNNTSVVVMLLYNGVLFVCPGDIEPYGWNKLWARYEGSYGPLIEAASTRLLVAPHHGRRSGYSREMMDAIQPHATFVSDVRGDSETHRSFRSDPIGIQLPDGTIEKYFSTKLGGRIQVVISGAGFFIDQYDQ